MHNTCLDMMIQTNYCLITESILNASRTLSLSLSTHTVVHNNNYVEVKTHVQAGKITRETRKKLAEIRKLRIPLDQIKNIYYISIPRYVQRIDMGTP